MSSNEENNKQQASESNSAEIPAVSRPDTSIKHGNYQLIDIAITTAWQKSRSQRQATTWQLKPDSYNSDAPDLESSDYEDLKGPLSEVKQIQKFTVKKIRGIAKEKTPAQIQREKTSRKQRKTKNQKAYDIVVVYQKTPTEKLGATRIQCGTYGEDTVFNTDADTQQKMREYYKELLVDHNEFSFQLFTKMGGILNAKFWDINLSWCMPDVSLDPNHNWYSNLKVIKQHLAKLYV